MPADADWPRAEALSLAFGLVLAQVLSRLLWIRLDAAVDVRLCVPFEEVDEVTPRPAVLEPDEKEHGGYWDDVLEKDVEGDPGDLAMKEPSENVGQGRNPENDEQVLKFEVHDRNAGMQVSVDLSDVQRHIALPQLIPFFPCWTKNSARRMSPESMSAMAAAAKCRIHGIPG